MPGITSVRLSEAAATVAPAGLVPAGPHISRAGLLRQSPTVSSLDQAIHRASTAMACSSALAAPAPARLCRLPARSQTATARRIVVAAAQPPAPPAQAAPPPAAPRRLLLAAAAAAVAALLPVDSAQAFGSGFPGYDVNMDARKRAEERNKREIEAMMARAGARRRTRPASWRPLRA